MNLDKYPIISDNEHLAYEFLSEGANGTVKKVVFVQEIGDNFFNPAFGDWDQTKQKIDDKARSNNNDRDKVLATVASTVIDFINYYPQATIFARGSTPGRTRLYQIGLFANWSEISQLFNVEGFANGEWHPVPKTNELPGAFSKG